MRDKLRSEVLRLFEGATETPAVRELREEIVQNTLDRYDDCRISGVSEEEAYRQALAGVGDVDSLLISLKAKKAEEKPRESRRVWTAIATALYIMCVVPVIICETVGAPDWLGVSLMFAMIAIATAMRIIGGAKEEKKPEAATMERKAVPAEVMIQKEHQPSGGRRALRIILTIFWWIGAVGLFLYVGKAGWWQYAWLAFVIAAGLGELIQGIFAMARGRRGLMTVLSGAITLFACYAYFEITAATHNWAVTWLVFPICACIEGIISGIITIIRGGK